MGDEFITGGARYWIEATAPHGGTEPVIFVNCTQYGALQNDAEYSFGGVPAQNPYQSAHVYRHVNGNFQQVTLTAKNNPGVILGVYNYGGANVTFTNRSITWTGPVLVNGVNVLSATDSGPALDPTNTDEVIKDENAVTGGVVVKFMYKPKEDEEESN
ncbi:uncharacterized protein EI97DRAFT_456525 [Westerdykella ornata]|uniref:Uncharacterized protein n=1 Tax=Westerdykella ornata TaxID=318751 RepID=A0A6A6JRE1_WESOR|nr:uncharacterized protein EI97DRAFT_456525 [Westerdykella ornata]KAF2279132.1 hypothetical protein EI97DRAFT_456525 [Westerdykella ornata]